MVNQTSQGGDRIEDMCRQYDEAERSIAKIRDDSYFSWTDREALLLGRLRDGESDRSKSKVNTQELTNIVFDGASRVMAQYPTGKIYPATRSNQGSAAVINLVFNNYVIPNANQQFNFLTKLRLWDVYSRVYGSMPALVDYVISDDYIGPDMWLINPRNFFVQAGVFNLDDAQYCFIDNWVSVEWLESRKKLDSWNKDGLSKLIKLASSGSESRTNEDSDAQTYIQREMNSDTSDTNKYARVKITTRYEKGRWRTFSKEHNIELRDIPNPHGNNKLPVVMKECYPLIDRLYGLAEFERGKTLQYAINSLVNLYLDGVKFSIFPPTISVKNGVVKESMKFAPGAHWQELMPNSIRQMQLNPQGIQTFTETYGFMKASILNMAATTDTSVSKETDPGYGKTPEALRLQSSREGARDSWDRFMMEQAITGVYERFIDCLANRQDTPIDISLFGKEIEEFQAKYPDEQDLLEVASGVGRKTVDPTELRGNWRYILDPGTTLKKDESIEHDSLRDLIMLAVRVPGGLEQIGSTGKINFGDKQFDFGEAIKRFVITSGITDGDKIVRDATPEEQAVAQQQAQMQEMMQTDLASSAVPGEGMAPPTLGANGMTGGVADPASLLQAQGINLPN